MSAADPIPPVGDELAVLDDPLEQQRFTRYHAGPDGQRLADTALRLSGMHCAACAGLIENAVRGVDGVVSVEVSAAAERAQVRWLTERTRLARIVAAIRAAGYDAVPDTAIAAREARRQEARAALWRFFVAALCSMQIMMLAAPTYGESHDPIAPDLRQLLGWGSWVLTLPVLVFSAGPFFSGAWRSLRARRIGMDVPVALGIVVTFVASSGATFDPDGVFGHELYFDSLSMFVAFLLGGRWLETRARHRVAQVLESTASAMPATAWRIGADGGSEEVSVRRLVPGDVVRVPLGGAFPADGELIDDSASADESLLTGESTPVPKARGDTIVGGSINLGAPVTMRVGRVGADTRIEAIAALMRDAMVQRPSAARAADRWAAPFLWAVLVLAAASAAVWAVIDPARSVWVAVSVLIVTCPCALSLAVPSAMLAAASALARRGVLLQRLDALETLTRVRRIYFDKTGTVTGERLGLRAMRRVGSVGGEVGDDELRAGAAALARFSTHPLSRTVATASATPWTWCDVHEARGQGLEAVDTQRRRWRLGALAYVEPGAAAQAPPSDAGARVWFGPEGRAWVRFDIDEVLRDGARETMQALRASGIEPLLLSGDRPDRARQMAQQLGIERAIGHATPESKVAEIVQAQDQGLCVAMIGDGVNDAPVLACADVSLAMGHGALIARAQADAVLVSGRLGGIVDAFVTARRAMRIVRQNITWAIVYNAACVPLALAGALPPWAAGLGMATSSLLVIGNAMRLAR